MKWGNIGQDEADLSLEDGVEPSLRLDSRYARMKTRITQ